MEEYLQSPKEDDKENNMIGFLEWQANHPNEMINLTGQLVLNYVLAFFSSKIGVRNNGVRLAHAARFKFDDLFNAFKHPVY